MPASFVRPDASTPGPPLPSPSAAPSHSHSLGSVTFGFKQLSPTLTLCRLTPSGTHPRPVSLCPPGPPHSLPCSPPHGPSPVLTCLLASIEPAFRCQSSSLHTPQAPWPLCHTQLAKLNWLHLLHTCTCAAKCRKEPPSKSPATHHHGALSAAQKPHFPTLPSPPLTSVPASHSATGLASIPLKNHKPPEENFHKLPEPRTCFQEDF